MLGATLAAGISTTLWADQVILDDLVIDGSACFGFDCVNGESFGFDTIRMKENNVRIKFQDTSSSASFPSVDWQLTANDSSNGGENHFSIEDVSSGRVPFKVVANSPTGSLVVAASGNVGLGTQTPLVEAHTVNGDTPTLRLEQDSSFGWGAQVWDVAANESNFFIRDNSNGSLLPLRIRPGAPTNTLFLDDTGQVGLGTQSPSGALHVAAASSASMILEDTSNASKWTIAAGGADNTLSFSADGGPSVQVDSAGNLSIPGDLVSNNIPAGFVPDYVFGDDYELLSIESLEKFIEKEHHLPGIPSAHTVSEQGLNHVEFQLGLLEKIEELTLYAIAQEKRIEKLTQENESISGRVSQIESALKALQAP